MLSMNLFLSVWCMSLSICDILLIDCDDESVINIIVSVNLLPDYFLSLPDKFSTRVDNEHCINL